VSSTRVTEDFMNTARIALAASLAAALTACGGAQSGSQPGTGSAAQGNGFTVLLKDAPANFNAAVVTISEIDLVGSDTVVLSTTAVTTDLLKLSNDTATLVKDAVVPPGHYTQLRFVITGGYVDVGGQIYASSPDYAGLPAEATVAGKLQMPSYAQSGLKIDLPSGGLDLGTSQKIVVVDFDVSRSFGHQAGNSGMWVMHPVCKATDIVMTGTLAVTLGLAHVGEGTLQLPEGLGLGDFTAVLAPAGGGDTVKVPFAADTTGTFGATFKYLAPGDYVLTLQAPQSVASFTTAPPVPVTVTILSGQVTSEALSLTGVVMTGAVDVTLTLADAVYLPSGVTLGGFTAILTPASGPAATAPFTGSQTGFAASFPFLAPGSYQLTLGLPVGVSAVATSPALPVSVAVVSQQVSLEAVAITSVTK
jgi:hypothetical protein